MPSPHLYAPVTVISPLICSLSPMLNFMRYLLSFTAKQPEDSRGYQAHNGYRAYYGARLFDCVEHFHGVPLFINSSMSASEMRMHRGDSLCDLSRPSLISLYIVFAQRFSLFAVCSTE